MVNPLTGANLMDGQNPSRTMTATFVGGIKSETRVS